MVECNTLRPRQNGCHFRDNIFKYIFLNENVWISIKISLKFVPKGPINNIAALVQIMLWHRPGDKPLSEPMMDSLLMHICITWPQWVEKTTPVMIITLCMDGLTHWGRDKMAAALQTTFSNAFSWVKMYEFWLKFHWSLFLGVQLTIFHHWFR